MRHEEFAEQVARRLDDVADHIERGALLIGPDGEAADAAARANEMRVASRMVLDEALSITRAEGESSTEPLLPVEENLPLHTQA